MRLRKRFPAALLLLTACVQNHVTGLLPEQPAAPGYRAESVRPTLRWETFAPPGAGEVTYEVRLFLAAGEPPENAFYSRSGLREPRHAVDSSLEPNRTYYWTVRAHFSVEGRPRHTQWAGFTRPDVRSARLPGPPPEWYPLRTPGP